MDFQTKPVTSDILTKLVTAWEADEIETYSVDTEDHPTDHTSIESLDLYRGKPAKSTCTAQAKCLSYLRFGSFRKEIDDLVYRLTDARKVLLARTSNTMHWYKGPSSFLGWHTNADSPIGQIACWLVYVKFEGGAFFRYEDKESGEIVTDYDKPGWYIRTWDTGGGPWHCVYSDIDRLSIGYQLY